MNGTFPAEIDVEAIERAVLVLNRRLALRTLAVWQGKPPEASDYRIYEDFRELLNPERINEARRILEPSRRNHRLCHHLLAHYLQYQLFPYDNELASWAVGAAAHVDGEKIYLKDVYRWCQTRSDLEKRKTLERETSALAKFLRPFALSSWERLLELLEEEFGYPDYMAYCQDKKGLDYDACARELEDFLQQTDAFYRQAMDKWVRKSLGVPFSGLNRFDAIYLLGLNEKDTLFPKSMSLDGLLSFFDHWGIHVDRIPGLHLDMQFSEHKFSQAVSFAVDIPNEVHLVMSSQGGWADLETLFHEMGHALSSVFTAPDLPPEDKDLNTSNLLSEAHAFLLQNMCFSPAFLKGHLKLDAAAADEIACFKALKDMAFFRRYAARFLVEYEMFRCGENILQGDLYAEAMTRHTGFSHRPEMQFFDLLPEFYSLDYALSLVAEAALEHFLQERLGEEWMFHPQAPGILKGWWEQGNRRELEEFLSVNGIAPFRPADLMKVWEARLL